MPAISPKIIEDIAKLARLELSEEEKKMYATQLSAVFSYIEQLNEVDTDGVPETCQVTGLMDVTRADVAVPADSAVKKKLLAQFPERVGDLLQVKAVFENF